MPNRTAGATLALLLAALLRDATMYPTARTIPEQEFVDLSGLPIPPEYQP